MRLRERDRQHTAKTAHDQLPKQTKTVLILWASSIKGKIRGMKQEDNDTKNKAQIDKGRMKQ
jgi:hypothetical protein